MLASHSTTIWYAMRATGIVALVLLTGTVVLGILTAGRARSRSWPAFAQADLHKRISLLAMAFLALHVLTAVVDTYVHVGWASVLVPFVSPYRPLWTGLGTVGVDLLAAVAISSALRQRMSASTWRAIHWLAYGSWPVAMAHSLGMGTDASRLWMDALAAACTLAVGGAVAWRVHDHREVSERAARTGAITRAVPVHRADRSAARMSTGDLTPRPGSTRPVSPAPTGAGAPVEHRNASPTRLLEKDRP
jgi:sulfoxide reductase heme-binding subunit YedZ